MKDHLPFAHKKNKVGKGLALWYCQIPFGVVHLVWGAYHLNETTVRNGTILMVVLNSCEFGLTNGTRIFQSFQLEWEKRDTTEDFHLFRKISLE